MMMKKLLFSSLFLFGSLVSQAQHEYTIEGKVEGVKDGTLVSLFLLDGNVGSTVAMDTIQNGTFFFKRNAGEDGLDKLSLMCTRNDDFPSMSLEIYATLMQNQSNRNEYLDTYVDSRQPCKGTNRI